MILRRLTDQVDLTISICWYVSEYLFGSWLIVVELAHECIWFHLTGGVYMLDQASRCRNCIRESSRCHHGFGTRHRHHGFIQHRFLDVGSNDRGCKFL